MDERLKILLGSEDIIARDNEDLYININLNRSFFEYKREKYDNDFDLAQQFDKERNLSRNFRVYGIVDSNIIDTNSLSIKIYSDSGTTNLISQTSTTSMNFNNSINVFNKKKGKYYFSLNNYSGSSVFIQIQSNNNNIATQTFEQKLVFYDFDGDFIPYGTETIEIDNNLNTLDINNNFPFFYNKHWVKKNISLQETKYPFVNFSGSSETIFEGQLASIVVYLDKPSPFGSEKVDFVFDSGTADTFEFLVYSNTPSNPFPGTVQLSFSPGEQYKRIFFSASTDNIVEVLENYKFRLDNFINVKSGSSLTYTMQIENSAPRKFAIYEIPNLYENRTPYVGTPTSTTSPTITYSTPSILRNGLYYGGLQNEFYPVDEVEVDIANFSQNTVLIPPNPTFGNIEDELLVPGAVKTFTIIPNYTLGSLNQVSIYLPPSLNDVITASPDAETNIQQSIAYVLGNISINGFVMEYTNGVYPVVSTIPTDESTSYEALKRMLGDGTFDIYNVKDIYKPFTITTDDENYKINIKAKSVCTRLDVKTNLKETLGPNSIATATTITQFSFTKQSPIRFTLLGNENNGEIASYRFRFRKKGYRDLNILNAASASAEGQINYLVTSVKNVLHNWDTPNNTPIAFNGNPIKGNFLPNTYFLPKSEAFYPGLLLLNNSDTSNSTASNLTTYGSNAFTTSTSPLLVDSGRWFQTPLNVIQKTSIGISNEDVSQVTLLKINTPAATSPTSNLDFYSFNYRNGTTGAYTTFYWNGANNANLLTNSGNGLKISGSTTPRDSPGLKYELDQGVIYLGQTIPVGPINVDFPGYNTYELAGTNFYSPYYPTTSTNNNINYQGNGTTEILLTAKSPGTPFEIADIVNNNPSAEIVAMTVVYNQKDGVTSNPYNNRMGGFSLTAP
jgi:hypothetical protein